MKYSILILSCVLLFSCGTKPEEKNLVPGRIADTKCFFHNGDSLLWVNSVYSTEHQEYSSSSIDKTATYSHENSLFTVFRLQNNNLQVVYQKEVSCIDHQKCGTRYTDKLIAYSSSLLAFNCLCEGKLVIMDIANGKDWSDLPGLEKKFKECHSGITSYHAISSRPDVLELELSDGTVAYLSLDDQRMMEWDKSFDAGTTVNTGSRYGEDTEQKIYFAPNDGDHRSFLVVRSLKSGTSQDYKHRSGEGYWLNPILLNNINSSRAYIKDGTFYALHSKTWNDYQERDLLSKLTTKGETLYTIELKELGEISTYVASDTFIYITTKDGLYIYDATTGKRMNLIRYDHIKNSSRNAA